MLECGCAALSVPLSRIYFFRVQPPEQNETNKKFHNFNDFTSCLAEMLPRLKWLLDTCRHHLVALLRKKRKWCRVDRLDDLDLTQTRGLKLLVYATLHRHVPKQTLTRLPRVARLSCQLIVL